MESTSMASTDRVQAASKTHKTVLDVLDRCPPFAVYYGCGLVNGGKRMSVAQMAAKSGISYRTILRTAYQSSWKNVKIGVMDKFCSACGVNPMNPEVVLAALKSEIDVEMPFSDVPPWRRKAMIRRFNMLCHQAAIESRSGQRAGL